MRGELHLSGGIGGNEGRVETCRDGKWRILCATSDWSKMEAAVICRQLGLNSAGMLESLTM